MKKSDDIMNEDIVYPHFVQLNTSYIKSGESADNEIINDTEEKYTFDKYKIKPEDDNGMIADTEL